MSSINNDATHKFLENKLKQKITNFEKIKAMTTEELSKYLSDVAICECGACCDGSKSCADFIKIWLEKEVKS